MTELKDGCVKPARGPIASKPVSSEETKISKEDKIMARDGQLAIDFEANAYINVVSE